MPPRRLSEVNEYGTTASHPMTEDEILAMLGYDPEPVPEYVPQEFEGGSPFLERFSDFDQLQLPPARSFGMGLAQGLVSGLGGRGKQALTKREKFERTEQARKAQVDEDRRSATLRNRQLRGTMLRDFSKQQREEKQARDKFNRDNPIVDDNLIAAHPDVPGLHRLKGQPIERDYLNKFSLEAPERKAKEARDAASLARSEAMLQLALDNAKRSANAADINAYDKLQANYAKEPAVIAYNGVRSNLTTAESAAKQNNGVGDVALIYSWHRSLEPDKPNVVREGDVALSRSTISALQQAYNIPARFFSGDQLTPLGRRFFLNQMRSALKAREADYKAVNDQYRANAQSFGQPPERFIRDVSPGAQIQAKGMRFVEPD